MSYRHRGGKAHLQSLRIRTRRGCLFKREMTLGLYATSILATVWTHNSAKIDPFMLCCQFECQPSHMWCIKTYDLNLKHVQH